MKRSKQVLAFGGLFALAIFLGQGSAQAQGRPFGTNQWKMYQQQWLNQNAMYNQQLISNLSNQVYSTQYYGSAVNPVTFPNFFPSYNYPTTPYYPSYYPQVATPYSPPSVNPYVPTSPGYGGNPYGPTDPLNPYNPYSPYNPYNPYNNGYGAGAVLTGSADVIRSVGQYMNSQEQARITREKALQAGQETRKLKHDTDMYIEATTPTFTQRQERNAKNTLQRIQKNSLPGEIAGGKSLNLLLKDLLTFRGKTTTQESLHLSEPVLAQLNVTKSTYGMGLLRDNGKVVWPGAVQDRLTVTERRDLDKKLQTLVKDANDGRINKDTLTDIRNEIERLREDLVAKVNDIPTTPYLEGKRFLQELYEATRALEAGEAVNQREFQIWIEKGKGGRSVKELVEYLGDSALRFGPATTADEASYRAAYQAMANYDLALNQHFAADER